MFCQVNIKTFRTPNMLKITEAACLAVRKSCPVSGIIGRLSRNRVRTTVIKVMAVSIPMVLMVVIILFFPVAVLPNIVFNASRNML
jgi:hypothetical protein